MSNRGIRVSSVVVALAIVAAACSSGGSKGAPNTSSTTATSSAPGSTKTGSTHPGGTTVPVTATTKPGGTTPTTIAAAYKLIAALMIVNVPSGFIVQPDKIADTGATNFAKANQDSAAADGATVLRQAGFQLGYQRSWVAGNGVSQNAVFLYRFATPAGAAQYTINRAAEIQSTLVSGKIKVFPVLLAGAIGLHNESATSSFAAVVVSKGVYSIEAVATDGTNADQSAAATALAQAQFLRLP